MKVRNSMKRIKILIENNKVLFDNVALPIGVCNLNFWNTLNGFSDLFSNKLYITRTNKKGIINLKEGQSIVIFSNDYSSGSCLNDYNFCVILKDRSDKCTDAFFTEKGQLICKWKLFTIVRK